MSRAVFVEDGTLSTIADVQHDVRMSSLRFALKRAGSWFQVVSSHRCEGCQKQFRITYTDKLTLFAKHEQEAVLEAQHASRQIAS